MADERGYKVLVIDDDPSINKLVQIVLRKEGYIVLEALNGLRGCKIARRERPDLIILDIMIPDIDGFEVFRRIRLDPDTKDIPVLFLSALTTEDAIQRGLCMGAKGYITKPFSNERLIDAIEEILG